MNAHRHLDQYGFILDDGSALALEAESIWNQWWLSYSSTSLSNAHAKIQSALDLPRPQLSKHLAFTRSSIRNMDNVFAWLRTSDLVTVSDGSPFPYHHTVDEMSQYLSTWTQEQADIDMRGAYWELRARPGGWSSAVTTNGNHRSLLTQALDIPIVRVRLSGIRSWSGDQYIYCGGGSMMANRSSNQSRVTLLDRALLNASWPMRMTKRFARLGLCTYTGMSIASDGSGEIHIRDVDPVLPWIMDRRPSVSRAKYREFSQRFG